jgi:hypothetical protein
MVALVSLGVEVKKIKPVNGIASVILLKCEGM